MTAVTKKCVHQVFHDGKAMLLAINAVTVQAEHAQLEPIYIQFG